MSRKILGLDIRNNAVSAVLINSSTKSARIEAHDSVLIPDQNEGESGLTIALETIVKKIDTSGCVCVASFPAELVTYRNIKVPFKNKKKIIRILPYELEPTLPFPVEDLIIDFHTIKISGNDDHTDIIAAGVEKSAVKTYLDVLTSLKIEPEILTISGYSTALLLTRSAGTPENLLFIDIEVDKATMFAVAGKRIFIIRSLPIFSTATSAVKSLGTGIQQTIVSFKELFDIDFGPEEILLTGRGLEKFNFERELSQLLELPVKRIELFRETDIDIENYMASSWNHEKMDNALALALSEIKRTDGLNFHKGSFAGKALLDKHKNSLTKTGILAGVVLALALLNFILNSYFMNRKIDRLNHQITAIFKTTFPEVTKIVDPLQQMKVKIEEARKSAFFSGKTTKQVRIVDVLKEISERIPAKADVELTRLIVGQGNVLISGNTDTFNSVDEIKSRIEQSELLQKVTITSTNKEKSGSRIRFKLKVIL